MNDNIRKINDIIKIGDSKMQKFVTFIQDLFLIHDNDTRRVGLSQFRDSTPDFSVNKHSIANKDVKLSDLLRRA